MINPFMLFAVLFVLLGSPLCIAGNTPITVQLRWLHQFQFAGYYAAIHKGFYQEAGLQVQLKEGGIGIDPVEEVLEKRAQFGVSSAGLVAHYLKGKPVLMLGPTFQHSPNILLIRGKIDHPSDLALNKNPIDLMESEEDIELKAMFVNEGIALNKIHFVRRRHHIQDLIDNKVFGINAYLSNEPFLLKKKGIAYSLLKPQQYGVDFYGDVLFCSRFYEQTSPEQVAAFRQATFKGWKYALEHKKELIDIIHKYYNTQKKSTEHLLYEANTLEELMNPNLIEIGHSNPYRWEHIAKAFLHFRLVPAYRSLDDFLYNPNKKQDLTWLYTYLILAFIALGIIGGIAFYIYRLNRRQGEAILKQYQVEAQLRQSEERYRIFFETAPSAGLVWRNGFIITDWNKKAEELFGWTKEEVVGRCFFDFLIPEEIKADLKADLLPMIHQNTRPHAINQNLTREGRVLTCEWFNERFPDAGSGESEVLSLGNDITERYKMELALRHFVEHDALTGLANRTAFSQVFSRVLEDAQRTQALFAVLFFDLDRFKPVNDTFGHAIGDELLKAVALRIRACLAPHDCAARIGGDEFVVLFPNLVDQAEAFAKSEHIRATLCEPFLIADKVLEISSSIGLAFYPEDGQTELALSQHADMAMYCAKKKGRNQVSSYDPHCV